MAEKSFEETLLLYAIAYECRHKGVATLAGILSAEDGVNRSAPTYEILQAGMNTLLSAGLVAEQGNGFIVTPEGKNLWDTANGQNGTVFDHLAYLEKILLARYSRLPVKQLYKLDPKRYQQAYASYYGAT